MFAKIFPFAFLTFSVALTVSWIVLLGWTFSMIHQFVQ
jgi:hypothetical protein